MSVARSRNDGKANGHDVSSGSTGPHENAPAAISRLRSLLVAATKRTSTRIVFTPPTRSNSLSCSARAAISPAFRREIEPISSQEQSAAAGQLEATRFGADRARERSAPRDRRAHSPSDSFGIAAQLTLMNGLSRARRIFVQRPRHELLARTALARDEHSRRACPPYAIQPRRTARGCSDFGR